MNIDDDHRHYWAPTGICEDCRVRWDDLSAGEQLDLTMRGNYPPEQLPKPPSLFRKAFDLVLLPFGILNFGAVPGILVYWLAIAVGLDTDRNHGAYPYMAAGVVVAAVIFFSLWLRDRRRIA